MGESGAVKRGTRPCRQPRITLEMRDFENGTEPFAALQVAARLPCPCRLERILENRGESRLHARRLHAPAIRGLYGIPMNCDWADGPGNITDAGTASSYLLRVATKRTSRFQAEARAAGYMQPHAPDALPPASGADRACLPDAAPRFPVFSRRTLRMQCAIWPI